MQVQKSVSQLVDDAVERLPFVRRRMAKRRLRRADARQDCCDRIMVALETDAEVAALGLSPVVEGYGTGAITADTPIGIDVEKLEKILELIVKYLPTILEIILPLFVVLGPVALLLSLPTTAQAHHAMAPMPQIAPEPIPMIAPEPAIVPSDLDAIASRSVLPQWSVSTKSNCPGGTCPVETLPAPKPVQAPQPSRVHFVSTAPASQYQRQWYNRDGLTLRQHAEVHHGYSTAGMTNTQVAMRNDYDHNRWRSGYHYATNGSFASRPIAGLPVRTVRYFADRRPARTVARRVIRAAPVRRVIAAIRPRNVFARMRQRRIARWGC